MILRLGLVSLASTASRVVAGAGATIVLARVLPPETFGTLCLSISWALLAGVIADFGLGHCVWNDIIVQPADARSLLRRHLRLKVPLGLTYMAVAAVLFTVIFKPEDLAIFAGVFAAIYLTLTGDYYCFALRGLSHVEKEARISAVMSSVYAVAVVTAGFVTHDAVAVVTAMVLARLAYVIVAGWNLFRVLPPASPTLGEPWKPLMAADFRRAGPVASDYALALIAAQIDLILVDILLDRFSVGIYGAGTRLVQASAMLTATLTSVFLPLIATSRNIPHVQAHRTGQLLIGFTTLGLAGLVGFIFFGPLFVRYLFGPHYQELNAYWWLFGSLVCVQFLGGAFGILLNSHGRQRNRAWVQAWVLPAIAILAFWIVPHLGITGMILLMFAGNAVLGTAYYVICLRLGLLRGVSKISLAMLLGAFTLLCLCVALSIFVMNGGPTS